METRRGTCDANEGRLEITTISGIPALYQGSCNQGCYPLDQGGKALDKNKQPEHGAIRLLFGLLSEQVPDFCFFFVNKTGCRKLAIFDRVGFDVEHLPVDHDLLIHFFPYYLFRRQAHGDQLLRFHSERSGKLQLDLNQL